VILVGSLVAGGGALPPTGPLGVLGADTWVHAAEYGLLAGLVAWAAVPRTRAAFVRVALAVAGYGVGVELLQLLVATRSTDPGDALANAVGAAVVVAAWAAVRAPGPAGTGGETTSDDG